MANSRESLLQEFVDWSAAHIRGDEKGEAQTFLDHLFRAFGQKGSLDVGGTPELRIRKSTEDGGGTAFADYVWKPIVVIEMKKRGTGIDHCRLHPAMNGRITNLRSKEFFIGEAHG
jgi:hypothetical protein